MDRLFIIIVIISLVFLFFTYILHRFFNKKRFVKYIPSLICLIIAVINIILARRGQGDGFRDLAGIIIAIFAFVGFLSGLLSAVYFDFISRKIK